MNFSQSWREGRQSRSSNLKAMRVTARDLGVLFQGLGAYELFASFGFWFLILRQPGYIYPDTPGDFQIQRVFVSAAVVYLFIFGIANVYVGSKLAQLLVAKPRLPLRFTKLCLLASALTLNPFGLGINLFVLLHLERLASEAQLSIEQRTLS